MLLVQKLLNHLVFELMHGNWKDAKRCCSSLFALNLDGLAPRLCVCVRVCIVSLVSSVSLITFLFTPILSYASYFLYFSSPICLSSDIFFLLLFLFHLWFHYRFLLISLSFVFSNTLPPLTSSSLSLPLPASYFISSAS